MFQTPLVPMGWKRGQEDSQETVEVYTGTMHKRKWLKDQCVLIFEFTNLYDIRIIRKDLWLKIWHENFALQNIENNTISEY